MTTADAADQVVPCPRRSPDSRDWPCILPDTAETHRLGHETDWHGATRIIWPPDGDDRVRWGTDGPAGGCDDRG